MIREHHLHFKALLRLPSWDVRRLPFGEFLDCVVFIEAWIAAREAEQRRGA